MLHPGWEHGFLVFVILVECFIFCRVIVDKKGVTNFLCKDWAHQFPEKYCRYKSSIRARSLFLQCNVHLQNIGGSYFTETHCIARKCITVESNELKHHQSPYIPMCRILSCHIHIHHVLTILI